MKNVFCSCLLATTLWAMAGLARGANPSIEGVTPPVGQRGSEFEITIIGSGLSACQALVFYSPNIRCLKLKPESDFEVRATIQADQNCDAGNLPFRILSHHGFSNLRTFRVTPFPIVLAAADENQMTECAYRNTTVYGVLEQGDAKRVLVNLKRGQRLAMEVEAVRLGYALLDTVLTVIDPEGNTVLTVDDTALYQQDPSGSFVASTDGNYTLSVHECNYDGGENSSFLLHFGDFPEPSVAYPAGGQVGTTLPLQFISPAGSVREQTVDLPSDATAGFKLFANQGGSQAPSPTPFRLTEYVNILEVEPNDDLVTSQVADVPIALNGILSRPGDSDTFSFRAEAGHRYRIDAFADRIGSPADSYLQLFTEHGQLIATNDDWGSHDSRIEWVAKDSGTYLLRISDKLNKGSAQAIYRVEITEALPQIKTFLPRADRLSQAGQTIAIPQGNRIVQRVAVRRELLNGEAELAFEDLPAGVHSSPTMIAADQFWAPAVIEANETAEIGGELCQLKVQLEQDNELYRGEFEQSVDLVASTADQLYHSVDLGRVAVAVTKPIPFRVEIEPPTTSLPRGGSLELVTRVEREPGFDQPVRVQLPFLPPWVTTEPFVVIPAGETEGVFVLEARPNAQQRSWSIVATATIDALSAEGDTTALEGREVASRLCPLSVTDSPVQGTLPVLAGEQGQAFEVTCELRSQIELPQDIEVSLEGLPNRTTATLRELTENKAVFQVEVASDAPIGSFEKIQCRLNCTTNEQVVSYVVAPQSRLLIAEPGKLKRSQDGRLLSPLEALRSASK